MAADTSLLRLLSCGSVDDGKSTLIGRLLYDLGILYEDQLRLLEQERTTEGLPDFSCLLDGLLAEREQSITIDAAYRSFTTASRRYIIADAPGHEQYTRNMATAASHADAALILIDASRVRDALLPQTARHTYIASLLGIADIIVAVNKMDRCGFEREVFERVRSLVSVLVEDMGFRSVQFVPVSALHGDNVCGQSTRMPWYAGQTLFQMLEELEPARQREQAFSFPVQWVARTGDFRGLAGTVAGGRVQVGQSIVALPSGVAGTVKSITTFDGLLPEAFAGDAVCIEMEQDLDISRGDVLADAETPLDVADAFSARIIWLNEPELARGRSYIFRQGTVETGAVVFEIAARMDLDSLSEVPAKTLLPNDIGRIKLSLDRSVPFAPYAENRDLGGFLLIDRISGNTLGAGMIDFALRRSSNVQWHDFTLNKEAHALQKQQTPRVLWFTGLSASGKSSLADVAARALYAHGRHTYLLDGDNLRHGLNRDLGFTAGDRAENIRRAGEVARLMLDAGLIVLACFISPYEAEREALRERFLPGEFLEIFVDTPLEECIRRDPKGLYAKALAGEIPNFTGISAPFEPPRHPALRVDGTKPLDDLAEEVLRLLL